jgi:hypothetical protein
LAQKVRIEYVDDLTGEADDTVSSLDFGLDGREYTIDLSEANAKELRDSLAKFIAVARRSGGSTRGGKRGGGASTSASSNREETQKIRAWAIDQKLPINPRGRISQDIQDQFYAVHGKAS